MTSNYSTIDVEEGNNRVKNVNVTINIVRIYTTLYNITFYYILNDIIQMTSNYSTINVEEENNRVRKS